jgi:hypothetical protein
MNFFIFSDNLLLIISILNAIISIYILIKSIKEKNLAGKIVGILVLMTSISLVYSLIMNR